MPLRLAACGSPPMALISKPQRVYFMTNQKIANSMKASTILRSILVLNRVGRRAVGEKLGVLLVSMGECQNPNMKKDTIIGATEFNSSVVIVSFTIPAARK